MDTFFGIPAHPLLVHLPAVILPLAAIGVVIMVIHPAWHHRYRWAVLSLGFVGAVGAILAADAGESLANRVVAGGKVSSERWDDHVQAGENARLFALIFFVVLAAFVLVPWFIERRKTQGKEITLPKWVGPALAVLVLAGSAGTVITVIDAGHTGAKAVWCDTMSPPNCGG